MNVIYLAKHHKDHKKSVQTESRERLLEMSVSGSW